MLPKRLTPLHYVASLFAVASLVYMFLNSRGRSGFLHLTSKTDIEFWQITGRSVILLIIFLISYRYSVFPYYTLDSQFLVLYIALLVSVLYRIFKRKEKDKKNNPIN